MEAVQTGPQHGQLFPPNVWGGHICQGNVRNLHLYLLGLVLLSHYCNFTDSVQLLLIYTDVQLESDLFCDHIFFSAVNQKLLMRAKKMN